MDGQQKYLEIKTFVTKISFEIADLFAKKGKLFVDGEIVKSCLKIFTDIACPDESSMANDIRSSHKTLPRRFHDLSGSIQNALIEQPQNCDHFCTALNEFTDTAVVNVCLRSNRKL